MSIMVRTPRPSSPTRHAKALQNSTSDDRIGNVAELVLEPLEAQAVDLAVRLEARHQETGQPARRLRQHQKHVAHRRRHEPLVTGNAITFAVRRAWVVLARTSVPPCFSVMPMPMVTPVFSGHGINRGSYFREAKFSASRAPATSARLRARRQQRGSSPPDTCARSRPAQSCNSACARDFGGCRRARFARPSRSSPPFRRQCCQS